MNILTVGGCGFIGSYVSNELVESGNDVLVFDNDHRYRAERFADSSKVKFHIGDATNGNDLLSAFNRIKPEIIVHLASNAVAKYCDLSPRDAYQNNIVTLLNALLIARSVNIKRFVYISSSYVYGDFQYEPCDEQHPTNPKGIYGGSKLAGEIITKTFCEKYGIEWVIVRPSAVYGETDINKRVVQVFLENAIKGEPLILNGNGSLDFTYIEDVAHGICLATLSPYAESHIFNITYGQSRKLQDLAKIINSLVAVDIIQEKNDLDIPKRGTLDISKAKRILGYKPEYSLENGVRKYYDWMVKQ